MDYFHSAVIVGKSLEGRKYNGINWQPHREMVVGRSSRRTGFTLFDLFCWSSDNGILIILLSVLPSNHLTYFPHPTSIHVGFDMSKRLYTYLTRKLYIYASEMKVELIFCLKRWANIFKILINFNRSKGHKIKIFHFWNVRANFFLNPKSSLFTFYSKRTIKYSFRR